MKSVLLVMKKNKVLWISNVCQLNLIPKEPPLQPVWFSLQDNSNIYLEEAKVDTGAGCNNMPLFLHKETLGSTPIDPPMVTIRGFGGQQVHSLGSKMVTLHIGEKNFQCRFQVCDVEKHPIIGRDLAHEMGYIRFPELEASNLQSKAVIQK